MLRVCTHKQDPLCESRTKEISLTPIMPPSPHWQKQRFSIFWVCLLVGFLPGSENGRCVASEYFTEPDIELTTENTANILSEYSF